MLFVWYHLSEEKEKNIKRRSK